MSPIEAAPIDGNIASVLSWIIGVLITVIIGLFAYFKSELNKKDIELKDERTYIRSSEKDQTGLFTEITIYLQSSIAKMDKGSEETSKILSLQEALNSKLSVIINHLNKTN